ncbi:MAG: flagellar hook-length control protein FliK [Deltaproteobacteria bacterium]|nr:flagellar hook-length control protein FliK [Deltaproteobacteria bacterium]
MSSGASADGRGRPWFVAPRAERRAPIERGAFSLSEAVDQLLALTPHDEGKRDRASDPTFFPRRPPPRARRVEPLVESMAEGVLVGVGADGGQEIRVELSDEFLGGTEVRISVRAGIVSAFFQSANAAAFEVLARERDRLEALLLAKGLRVDRIEISRPA